MAFALCFEWKVAPKIKSLMLERGSGLISYQTLGTNPNFFRITVCNPSTEEQDLDFLLEEISELGENIDC